MLVGWGVGGRIPLKDFDNVRAVMLPIWEGEGSIFVNCSGVVSLQLAFVS